MCIYEKSIENFQASTANVFLWTFGVFQNRYSKEHLETADFILSLNCHKFIINIINSTIISKTTNIININQKY